MLRLAWSDAVTYDSTIREWPYSGGVNGSIHLDSELSRAPNAGLQKAIALLTPIKNRFQNVSWADLIQMAAVVAIKQSGGPDIELVYGREDASHELLDLEKATKDATNTRQLRNVSSIAFKHAMCPVYPSAVPPYPDGAPSADVHLRNVFYRMGLNNRETVALCGGHTLGRAFKDRTGVCTFSSGDQGATVYTQPTSVAKVKAVSSVFCQNFNLLPNCSCCLQGHGQTGIGMAGGEFYFAQLHQYTIFHLPHAFAFDVSMQAAAGRASGCSSTTRTSSAQPRTALTPPSCCGCPPTRPSTTPPSFAPTSCGT